MPIFGGTPPFETLEETGKDSNSTSTTTLALDISTCKYVSWNVQAATGTHGTHIITLQCSVDSSSWANTSSTLTGLGTQDNIQITTQFVRLKVTTAESATSTVDVVIQAK